MNITPWEHQLKGLNDIYAAYRSGYRAPIYVLPTGGGKTGVIGLVTEKVIQKNGRVLVLTHKANIKNQISKHFTRIGIDHGIIDPDHSMTGDKIQVASVFTAVNRLDRIQKPNIIIIDEAHHTTATTWMKILEYFSGSYVLGMTATACRYDGKPLGRKHGGAFDTIVYGPNYKYLIEKGFLTPSCLYAPGAPVDMSGVPLVGGDYSREKAASKIDKPVITGCAIEHYLKLCPNEPAIAFCQTVKHAEHVAQQFNEAGIPSSTVDGKMSESMISHRIDALASGKIKMLSSCELISEGTDVPVVSDIIMLRRTMSLSRYKQMGGRGLRAAPQIGKTRCVIQDHVGNSFDRFGHKVHGFVDEDVEYSLDGEVRCKKNQDEEKVQAARRCSGCYAMYPAYLQRCPECGKEYFTIDKKIEVVAGELVQITGNEIEDYKKIKRMEVRQANSYEELRAIAARRGYNQAWTYRMWNLKKQRRRYA
jgi:DNA repair protein RadD